MNENVPETVCEAIFLLIPEVACLRELYMKWYTLRPEEKSLLDSRVSSQLGPDRGQLYKPLKRALMHWDHLQNTQGAPGCEPGLVSFSCLPQLETDLLNLIHALQRIVKAILEKREDQAKKRAGAKKPFHGELGSDSPVRNKSKSPSRKLRKNLASSRAKSADRLSE